MNKFVLLFSLLLYSFTAHAQHKEFTEQYAKSIWGFEFWNGASQDKSSYGTLEIVRKGSSRIIGNSDILRIALPDERILYITKNDSECSIQTNDIIVSWLPGGPYTLNSPYVISKVRFVRGDGVYMILENANGDIEKIPIRKIFHQSFKNGEFPYYEATVTDNIFDCIKAFLKKRM